MARKRKPTFTPLPREVVERIAKIMGDDSGCGQALAEVARRGNPPVRFWQHGMTVVVEWLEAEVSKP